MSILNETQGTTTDDILQFPTSLMQRSLWFLEQLEPDKSTYTIPGAIRIEGPLNTQALAQSINEIVRRHEILRTTFDLIDGEPFQIVHPTLTVTLPLVDLKGISENDKMMAVESAMQEEAQCAFHLKEGPLIRTKVLRLQDDVHILFLAIHHCIFDGWSLAIFVRELTILYEAFVTHTTSPLPPPMLQFADVVLWQRERLAQGHLDTQLAYWKKQLAGAPSLLDLPSDHPRLPAQAFRGKQSTFLLSKQLTEAVQALSEQKQVTPFMLLFTAFVALLFRYSGQQDIIVGTSVANRNHQEIEEVIGPFVNMLAIRTCITNDDTFMDTLQQVRETLFDAYAHQDIPFGRIVNELGVERSSSYLPLCQVIFAFQNTPVEPLTLQGLKLEQIDILSNMAKFDLSFDLTMLEEGIEGVITYNTDMFEADTITRMSRHFETLLTSCMREPEQRVQLLSLLQEEEKQHLLYTWNATHQPYSDHVCIHWLIEEQVQRHPHNLAVIDENEKLTYGQLDQRANQLAHYLSARGVGPEVLVGLCMERGIHMIVGLLAIWKAGGAYVPLDPATPAQRLALLIQTTPFGALVTQEALLPTLGEHHIPTICIDRDQEDILRENVAIPEHNTYPENLAYGIYTSGSTGTPKGVLVQHQGLCNMADAQIKVFDVRPESRVLQFASISFDASLFEIVMALRNGAQLYLTTKEMILSSSDFLTFLGSNEITIATLPPSMLLSQPIVSLPKLETIIVAGEACPRELVTNWSPGRHFFNAYGPTETTIWATVAECTVENTHSQPPIGQPIANTQTYVLDQHFSPVAIGVVGELYVGGSGLARAYLLHGDLTAERFIPHPFSGQPGARLYRTGDLVRYRADGVLEFVGRTDHQIKLRGFRIETGEIEATLREHPALRESVVILREDHPGEKQLVAYFVSHTQENIPSRDELHHFLRERLPHYMTPAIFVPLDAIPLSINGKIDKAALPSPKQLSSAPFVAARTPQEQILAQIWAEVLRVDQVSIYDNFFEMGGDSILAILFVSKANEASLAMKPKHLFMHPQIADLAAHVDFAQPVQQTTSSEDIQGSVPLTPIQHWFFRQEQPVPHQWNQSLFLTARYPLDAAMLAQALLALITHHDAFRLRFERTASGWQQYYTTIGEHVFCLQEEDLSALPVSQQTAMMEQIAIQAQGALHLTAGPLLRAVLFHLGTEYPDRLLLIAHRLVIDPVSWRILLEDLLRAYEQGVRGEQIQLPPRTTSVQEWSRFLEQYASSEHIQQQLPYWLSISNDSYTPLIRDFSEQTKNIAANVEHVIVELTCDETNALLHDIPRIFHTQIDEVLLTVLARTLTDWLKTSQVLIDLGSHGREDLVPEVDLSRTIGWFTALFPMKLVINNRQTITDSLLSVKEQMRQIPQKGIGYGLLRYLDGKNALNTSIRPEVVFNYLGQFDNAFAEKDNFSIIEENAGKEFHEETKRQYILQVVGRVLNGKLGMVWEYNSLIHRAETIKALAEQSLKHLRMLIELSLSATTESYTPSDFPLALLNQDKIEQLATLLDVIDEEESIEQR